MHELIICICLTAVSICLSVFCIMRTHRVEAELTLLTECFLRYIGDPTSINIVEDRTLKKEKTTNKGADKSTDFKFPNIEGF